MAKIEDELLNDFHQSLCRIDFDSYNPRSPEFTVALNVGLMWKVLSEMKIPSIEEEDSVLEEIEGAKHYMLKYTETKDVGYKTMAEDELKHASMLLDREKSLSEKKKAEYSAEIVNLTAKVKGMV